MRVVAGAGGVFAAGRRACASGSGRRPTPLWPDARGLVPALVVGDTSQTPADLTAAMLEHGTEPPERGLRQQRHLRARRRHVAVRRRRGPATVATAGGPASGLLGFVVLARPEPSVVRAAVMGTRRAARPVDLAPPGRGARRWRAPIVAAARVGPVAVALLRLRAVERRDPRSARPRASRGVEPSPAAARGRSSRWARSSRSRSPRRRSALRSSCRCRAACRSSRCSPTSSPRPSWPRRRSSVSSSPSCRSSGSPGPAGSRGSRRCPAQAIAAVARWCAGPALRQPRLG